jgi:hypothetical protein
MPSTRLGDHRDAMVLVGAQAVYLRVGDADLAMAPYTTDGDLVIDPAILAEIPPLEGALREAGFFPKAQDSVGVWLTTRTTSQQVTVNIAVDLLVPASVKPGAGRRAARLAGHDTRAARIVRGLEGALVDTDVMRLTALDAGDARAVDVRVAGPAALLVAKVHKIEDRTGSNRASDKDALDVLRPLRGTETEDLAARYMTLLRDARSADAGRRGLALLTGQFASHRDVGVEMAIRSAGIVGNAEEIGAQFEALVGDLLAALRERDVSL